MPTRKPDKKLVRGLSSEEKRRAEKQTHALEICVGAALLAAAIFFWFLGER